MSRIFTCGCGRRTTAPFSWSGELYCTVCMEDLAPQVVDSRAKAEWVRVRGTIAGSPCRKRSDHDTGKHRLR